MSARLLGLRGRFIWGPAGDKERICFGTKCNERDRYSISSISDDEIRELGIDVATGKRLVDLALRRLDETLDRLSLPKHRGIIIAVEGAWFTVDTAAYLRLNERVVVADKSKRPDHFPKTRKVVGVDTTWERVQFDDADGVNIGDAIEEAP